MITDPYAFASVAAEQIIKGEGITSLPINPKTFAQGKGFEVTAKPASNVGVSGMLVRYGNEFATCDWAAARNDSVVVQVA